MTASAARRAFHAGLPVQSLSNGRGRTFDPSQLLASVKPQVVIRRQPATARQARATLA